MFEYTLRFRGTKEHANADALSRLPLPEQPVRDSTPPELVLLANHLAESLVTAEQIRKRTEKDPVLSQVMQYLQQGWPHSVDSKSPISPFFSRKYELSLQQGCILWGNRVVVPEPGREAVLVELHEGHPGIARMKSLSRMYVWWPGITQDIERTVSGCTECQLHQPTPKSAPLHPWSWPTRPWARIHLDYAGPVNGKMYLILIDSHSKWIEAFQTSTATSKAVLEELRTTFARFGIPETVVTDNGMCFTSSEFEEFMQANGIKHITSAPYHPASNGLAERAVQIVKKGLKKITKGSIPERLAKILMTYRLTPQSTTGISPAELLLGRRPRSKLDLLRPNTAERVERQQVKQKTHHDLRAKTRDFEVGSLVFVRNYHRGDRWLPGQITVKTGPVSFVVKLSDGRTRRCHQDQIRVRTVEVNVPTEPEIETDVIIPTPNTVDLPPSGTESNERSLTRTVDHSADGHSTDVIPEVTNTSPACDASKSTIVKTYPKRARQSVTRFEPKW